MDHPECSERAGSSKRDVVATSPSSPNVVARFEFETGRGNEGTKVLFVEWHCDSDDEPPAEQCQVEWEGKTKVLPAVDHRDCTCRRLVFWLPPAATVPATISIRRPGRPILYAKPLPAIFPPGLGSDVPRSGRRGVLHTLWATTRLAVLEDEISREAHENTESVGIDMALKEKDFILDHFGLEGGVKDATVSSEMALPPVVTTVSAPPTTKSDGRSSMGVRMTEKLKGLKLATSPEGLAAAAFDIKSQSMSAPQMAPIPGMVSAAGMKTMSETQTLEDDDDGELFALPMSPRSPEMKRSPFSLI